MADDYYEAGEETQYRYLVQPDGEERERYCRRHYVSPFLVLSRKQIFMISCGVLALLLAAGYLAYLAETPRYPAAQVRTECGAVRGHRGKAGFAFKGIPYAAPPVGAQRWRPPADLKKSGSCWEGVYDATRFRDVCVQVQPMDDKGAVTGSEDCLYLNVWTPTLIRDAKLPVMFWIHGGYLHTLSGSEEGYRPSEELATQYGAVFVSLNYRLNAFGFLALELLRQGSPTNTSGNYGFMDQIAALQWVQRNIHVFGGDPEKVTIFGQSSGGTSVWTLMMSPLANGLFHRAIDMSGSYIYNKSVEEAERDNLIFLRKTGCQDIKCLQSLPQEKILKAIPWKDYPYWAADDVTDLPQKGRFDGAVAVVDGYVLPEPPFQMWEKKTGYNDVPFVIGTTEQEADLEPSYSNITSWSWEDYQWTVTDILLFDDVKPSKRGKGLFISVELDFGEKLKPFGEAIAEEALTLYPKTEKCPTTERCPERLYTSMVSDARVTCPNNDLAKRAANALKSPVYRYLVTYTPSKEVQISSVFRFPSRFAYHALDAYAFFGNLGYIQGETSSADRDFEKTMQNYFIHFAKTGEMPSEWPAYPSHTALLSNSFSVAESPSSKRCQFWENNGFYSYAWIN